MSRSQIEKLTKCFYICNQANYVIDKDTPRYDKLGQIRQMVDIVKRNFKSVWNLGKSLTIDEMMIRYKGTYCPARQYMPKKPQKWSLKVWCLVDSKSQYVYGFDIYARKNGENMKPSRRIPEEPQLAYLIETRLIDGNNGKGHVVVMDNNFSSVGLFEELARNGTYCTGTLRMNRIGTLRILKNTKELKCSPQGTLVWRMHDF